MADVQITYINSNGNNYYDFTLTNGDFTLDYGLDTSMMMSVLCEQRIEDQSVIPMQRGGWVGNILQIVPSYQQGSLIWTKYQSNMNSQIQSEIEGYLEDAFSWMIEDGIAKDVNVDVNLLANSKVSATITVTKNDDTQTSTYYDLWMFTGIN